MKTITLWRRTPILFYKQAANAIVYPSASVIKGYSANRQRSNDSNHHRIHDRFRIKPEVIAGTLGFLTAGVFKFAFARAEEKNSVKSTFDETLQVLERNDLPVYRLDEVKKHGRNADRVWITYQNGIYDITDFIQYHPGGTKILLAAGDAADPFWNIYQQHKVREVFEMLEEYRIGNLDPRDIVVHGSTDKNDMYANDPRRHPALLVRSQRPFNAETAPEFILDNFITPNELFFVRNHMSVPDVKADTHQLVISVLHSKKTIVLSVDDLKKNYESVSVCSFIQCGGNRRVSMAEYRKVQGLSWTGSAIGNAKWTGVKLKDVLMRNGIDPADKRIKHVKCGGCDNDAEGTSYETSIPFKKAMSDEVLLAYQMNGEDIPRDHGYPLRLIVPGVVGARQVKWLNSIILSDEESKSHWQSKDYKALPLSASQPAPEILNSTPAIQGLPVQSAFCLPSENTTINRDDDEMEVSGYACSGGGRAIIRVEVSADDGQTWQCAELEQDPQQGLNDMWAWTLFKTNLKIPTGAKEMNLVCKATDSECNTQPETPRGIWNIRGFVSNSWHRIKVKIVD